MAWRASSAMKRPAYGLAGSGLGNFSDLRPWQKTALSVDGAGVGNSQRTLQASSVGRSAAGGGFGRQYCGLDMGTALSVCSRGERARFGTPGPVAVRRQTDLASSLARLILIRRKV